jgi:hypothetical protein
LNHLVECDQRFETALLAVLIGYDANVRKTDEIAKQLNWGINNLVDASWQKRAQRIDIEERSRK